MRESQKALAKRVKRAGSDIAKNYAKRGKRSGQQPFVCLIMRHCPGVRAVSAMKIGVVQPFQNGFTKRIDVHAMRFQLLHFVIE